MKEIKRVPVFLKHSVLLLAFLAVLFHEVM